MEDFIASVGGPVPAAIMGVVCLNIALTAIGEICAKIKDHTETKLDDNMAAWSGKIVSFLGTIVDWLGGNREHK